MIYRLIILIFMSAILFFICSGANFSGGDSSMVIAREGVEQRPVIEIAQNPAKSPEVSARKSPSPKPTVKSTPTGEPSESPAAFPSGSPATSPGETPSPSPTESAPAGESTKAGFDIQQYRQYLIPVACGLGGLIVILIIVLVLVKRKKKHVCENCGKQVFPGMVYCEDCSDQRPSKAEPEKMISSPVATTTKDAGKAAKEERISETPKVKPRPSGRVIAVITVRRGANQGYRLNFYESLRQITIGSDAECDMAIEEDEEVSSRHAVITMSEDTSFLIHDMGNTSGLFVNSERVNRSGLKSGDVIRVGKTELTFARL